MVSGVGNVMGQSNELGYDLIVDGDIWLCKELLLS